MAAQRAARGDPEWPHHAGRQAAGQPRAGAPVPTLARHHRGGARRVAGRGLSGRPPRLRHLRLADPARASASVAAGDGGGERSGAARIASLRLRHAGSSVQAAGQTGEHRLSHQPSGARSLSYDAVGAALGATPARRLHPRSAGLRGQGISSSAPGHRRTTRTLRAAFTAPPSRSSSSPACRRASISRPACCSIPATRC